jgi:hypothetical protein
MLAGLLRNRNIAAESIPVHTAPRQRLELIETSHPPVVCVSALSPRFAVFARQMARRLRRSTFRTHIIVGLWQLHTTRARPKREWPPEAADEVLSSLNEAVDRIALRLMGPAPAPAPHSLPAGA